MKSLLIIFLFLSCTVNAKNLYFANAGNDNTGNGSIGTPYASITKLNSIFNTLVAGDSALFKSGDTFFGSVIAAASGATNNPIVIASYGTGAKPIFTGLVQLTGWASAGTNLWDVTAANLKKNVNILTINGIPYAVGRTPNNTYNIYDSATISVLHSSGLNGAPNYVGAELVMKCNSYNAQKAPITAQTSSTLTYTVGQPIENNQVGGPNSGTKLFGYFIQRLESSLDIFGEWFFNFSTKKMKIYSATNPSGFIVKASSVDTIFLLGNKANITLYNLSIEGGGMYGVETYSGTNITVKNCSFKNNTRAMYAWNSQNIVVDKCDFDYSFCGAIAAINRQTKQITITNNLIKNTGQFIGMGLYWGGYDLKGIIVQTGAVTDGNFINVTGNRVFNTGHAGIEYQGSNVVIARNWVDSFCNQLQDNGAIYTFVNNKTVNTTNYVNRRIDSNFITNSNGAKDGSNNEIDVAALYNDDQSLNLDESHNTIAYVSGPGIQMNNNVNINIRDNTIYSDTFGIAVGKKPFSNISGIVIRKNIIYQKRNTQFNFSHINENLQLPTQITLAQSFGLWDTDSNWISNLKTNGYYYYYRKRADTVFQFPTPLTLSQWQNTYFHDQHSILPPVTLTNTNSQLVINPTDTVKLVLFPGLSKIDPKGNVYNNSANIPRWSSTIFIDNGTVANQSPTANAGPDQSITLPTSTATLSGSGSDPEGPIMSYSWLKVSGPAGGIISSPSSASTGVTGLQQGTYGYQLTVTDNQGATASDFMQIVVNAGNISPTANAGVDQSVTLPTTTATLSGSGTDPDGSISAYSWVKISGPTGGAINSPSSASTLVTSLQPGTYVYQLTVTDNQGAAGTDFMQIVVNAANIAPTANAGNDTSITLPANTATLRGSGTDPDGSIVSYSWLKISGPAGGNITSSTSAITNVTSLQEGTYNYRLTVTDNQGATGTDAMQIIVNPAAPPINIPPTANAGSDQNITAPTSTATLTGSGTDPDGTIVAYLWTKIAGPAGGAITSSTSATTGVTGLAVGDNYYQLRVTDNSGDTATDVMKITVNAANQLPTANAGADQVLTSPTNSTTLTGSGTDPDGTISDYLWTIISGTGATITSPTSATTNITGLSVGVYTVQLRVRDNAGDSATDAMQITVNAANQKPTSNAGNDQVIYLPTNSTTLNGSGTDPDGTISAYLWTKISGPTGGTITSATSATTGITGLTEGDHLYQLRVTDNSSDTATDIVQITVNADTTNQNPVAQAGANKSITLPVDSVTLVGSGTDQDGTVVTYEWRDEFGTIVGITATITLNGLIQGSHVYTLTVTDDRGGIGSDSVKVVVNAAPPPPAPGTILINVKVNTGP